MRAALILLCIMILLFLIGQIRIGCKAAYDQNGIQVWLRLAVFQIQILPLKKRKKESEPEKDRVPEGKKKRKPKEPIPVKEKVGGALGYVQVLLPVLLDAVKYFTKKLQIDTLYMRLNAGASDPADAAALYGKANAALGALWYPLTKAFDVKDGYAKVDLDFDAPQTTIYAAAELSLKLGQIVWFGLYFGIRALMSFMGVRKRQKMKKAEKGG